MPQHKLSLFRHFSGQSRITFFTLYSIYNDDIQVHNFVGHSYLVKGTSEKRGVRQGQNPSVYTNFRESSCSNTICAPERATPYLLSCWQPDDASAAAFILRKPTTGKTNFLNLYSIKLFACAKNGRKIFYHAKNCKHIQKFIRQKNQIFVHNLLKKWKSVTRT